MKSIGFDPRAPAAGAHGSSHSSLQPSESAEHCREPGREPDRELGREPGHEPGHEPERRVLDRVLDRELGRELGRELEQREQSLARIVLFGRTSELLSDTDAVSGVEVANDRFAVPLDQPSALRLKRSIDLIVAGAALVLLAPLMVLVAILIKFGGGGSVFFKHSRIGRCGASFACYKFRTMVANGDAILQRHLESDPQAAREWRETRKLADDPRVTPIGRLLRLSSIDELPQLLNVLKGEMSCVGPRPVVADELKPYGDKAAYYLAVKPGLTGIWQVSGRNSLSYANRVKLDSLYAQRWSPGLDMAILLKTIPAVLRHNETS